MRVARSGKGVVTERLCVFERGSPVGEAAREVDLFEFDLVSELIEDGRQESVVELDVVA